jgi:hypothetical protein
LWPVAGVGAASGATHADDPTVPRALLAGTRLPLVSWLGAVRYLVNQKQDVSALGLQRVLGFGSYQTAWARLHKLRCATVRAERELLGGSSRSTKHVGGVTPGYAGRGTEGKALVAIAVECRERGPGRIRMRRIPRRLEDRLDRLVSTSRADRARVPGTGQPARLRAAAAAGLAASCWDIGVGSFRRLVLNWKRTEMGPTRHKPRSGGP